MWVQRVARESLQLPARDAIDAGGGGQPEVAAAIFDNGVDDLRQAGGGRWKGGDAAIAKQVQPTAVGADPELSGERPDLVLIERGDDIGGEAVASGERGDVPVQQDG